MKFTAPIIFAFLALSCNAQYREIRHSKITPTNTVVVAIPDWAKAEEPPASGDWQLVTNAYDIATNAYAIATNSYDVATNALTRKEAEAGFTEWTFSDGENHTLTIEEIYEDEWVYIIDNQLTSYEHFLSYEEANSAVSLTFDYLGTATRVRLPTWSDVILTPIYDGGTNVEWICSPSTYQGSKIIIVNAGFEDDYYPAIYQENRIVAIGVALRKNPDSNTIEWSGEGSWAGDTTTLYATLTEKSPIGYTLGTQTNYVLASTSITNKIDLSRYETKSNKVTDLPLNSQPFNLSSSEYFSTLGLKNYIDRLIANGIIESPSNLVEITDTHVPYAINKYPTAVSVQGQLLDIWAKIRGMTNTIGNIDESIGSINSNIEIIDEYVRAIHPDAYIPKVPEADEGEIAVFGNGDGSLIQSHVMLADVTNDIHNLISKTNSFALKSSLSSYVPTNSDKWVQVSAITTNSTSGDGVAYTLGERADGVNYGQNSLTQGRNNSAAGLWSLAMGDNNAARVKGTMALGVKSLASNNFAYVWSGVDSSGVTPRYGSHGVGSYSLNPVGDVYGFWIGGRNLYDIFRYFATNETNVTIIRNVGDEEDPIEAVEVATAMPLVKKSEFNSVASSVNAMWATLYGESVWIAVTNYMRQIAGTVPSLRLWEVRDNNTNLVYSSAEEIEHVVSQKVNAAESRIMAAMPSTAWGAYQSSGVENPSPEDITVVNSPKIMLSSGYTWQKCVETGSASVWVLKANGLMNLGGGEGAETNGYFRITDAEGNAQFEVIKTSDQEVGAIAADTDFDSSNNFTIRYNSSSASHPTLYCALSLADDFEGEDANGDINNLGISVTWAQDGGTNWIATVHQDSPSSSLFCHAKMMLQGTNLIKNSAPSSFDGGIYINNTRYRLGTATISGHLVLTLEAW